MPSGRHARDPLDGNAMRQGRLTMYCEAFDGDDFIEELMKGRDRYFTTTIFLMFVNIPVLRR